MSRGTIFLVGGINDVWVVGRAGGGACRPRACRTGSNFRWQQGFRAVLTFADLWRTDAPPPGRGEPRRSHPRGRRPTTRASRSTSSPTRPARRSPPTPSNSSTQPKRSHARSSSGRDSRRTTTCRHAAPHARPASCPWRADSTGSSSESGRGYSAPPTGGGGSRPGWSASVRRRDPAIAEKLHRIAWSPRFIRQGWIGGTSRTPARGSSGGRSPPGCVRPRGRRDERERVAGEHPLLDRLAVDQVLLHELRDAVGRHAAVPRPLRVDDHDRPVRGRCAGSRTFVR